MTIQEIDKMVTFLGIAYGALLIAAFFIRNKFFETIRIDALMMPKPTEKTRPLNLGIGIIVLGYCLYSLFKEW
ncbi:MAG: hypothetical protein OEV59_02265 [Deltaproteobacteria bacterium]|nr:hypothetical protein [Deltaproteobacteria bacterium]